MDRPALPLWLLQELQAWTHIGAIFQEGYCDECEHCVCSVDDPDEPLTLDTECDLGRNPTDKPTDCPTYLARVSLNTLERKREPNPHPRHPG